MSKTEEEAMKIKISFFKATGTRIKPIFPAKYELKF